MFPIKLMRLSSQLLKRCLDCHKVLNESKCLSTSLNLKSQQKSKQSLVIDLNFEDLMTSEECRRLAIDLFSIYWINSSVPEEQQFRVSLCHQLSKNSLIIEYLSHYLPKLQNLDNFQIESESYINLFDTKRLVYLSPDAKDLIKYDSNEVYIIGGLVKKKIFKKDFSGRITYSKAKQEGIRVGRFPIDHLISTDMKRGIVLFVPQVFNILNDIKSGHNWEAAARRNIPCWKLKPTPFPHYDHRLIQRNAIHL